MANSRPLARPHSGAVMHWLRSQNRFSGDKETTDHDASADAKPHLQPNHW